MKTSRYSSASTPRSLLQPKPSGCLIAVLASILTLGPVNTGISAQTSTYARNTALAGARLSGALSSLSLGFIDQARDLVGEALGFAPANPDANYLGALIGLATGDPLGAVLAHLELALAGETFLFHDRLDAEILYASLLVRVKRPQEALRFLEGKPADAEVLYAAAQARRLLGDLDGERELVNQALRRYPEDPRPALRWLGHRPAFERSPENAGLIARLFELRPALAELDRRLNILLVPYAPSPAEARTLVREYRAMGGSLAYSAVAALKLGLIDELRAIEELLAVQEPAATLHQLEWPDLEALTRLLSGPEAIDRLIETFRSYKGIVTLDTNRDGIHEIFIKYEAGLPVSMSVDDDQNGKPELLVDFIDGVPVSISLEVGTTRMLVNYDFWPYASTVELHTGSSSERYHFGHAVMPLPLVYYQELVRGSSGSIKGLHPAGLGVPSRTSLVTQAHRIERLTAKGSESLLVMDGIPHRAWWQDAYGRQGRTIYLEGLPMDDRLDLNGDGVFEARRHWRRDASGKPYPAYIEVDLNGDGLYEYRESLVPPYLKSWDLNGDGQFDISLENTILQSKP